MSGRSRSCATRGFFKRHADPLKEAAHHRGVSFDAAAGQKAIAERLKRDVRFLGPRRLQKFPMGHELGSAMPSMADRLSGAIPLQALQPFDGDDSLDLVAPRRRPAARRCLSPPRRSRGHAGPASMASASPAGLRPADRLNQNLTDSAIAFPILRKKQDALADSLWRSSALRTSDAPPARSGCWETQSGAAATQRRSRNRVEKSLDSWSL